MEIQTCIKCRQKKELNAENFYRKSSCKRGFESQCKECRRISDKKKYQKKKDKILVQKKKYYERKKEKIKKRQKEYYQANVEKCKISCKKWDQANPTTLRLINAKSRTLKHGGSSSLTESDWLKINKLFNNSCAYCGMSETEHFEIFNEKLHHEHVIPLIDGGSYEYGNVVPSCRSCNSSKANRDFKEWYPNSKAYSKEREVKIIDYISCKERRTVWN